MFSLSSSTWFVYKLSCSHLSNVDNTLGNVCTRSSYHCKSPPCSGNIILGLSHKKHINNNTLWWYSNLTNKITSYFKTSTNKIPCLQKSTKHLAILVITLRWSEQKLKAMKPPIYFMIWSCNFNIGHGGVNTQSKGSSQVIRCSGLVIEKPQWLANYSGLNNPQTN